MSREIKFRAWDIKRKKILPIWSIGWKTWDDNGIINEVIVEDDGTFSLSEHEVILMQFSGLPDKNKKEIYEGDIVKCGKSKDAPLAVVCFKQQSFLLKYLPLERYDNNQVYDYMDDYKHYTIIGNIYETKL